MPNNYEDFINSTPQLTNALNGNGLTSFAESSEGGSIDLTRVFKKFKTSSEAGVDLLEVGHCYVFMTKPNLNLIKNPIRSEEANNSDTRNYNSRENSFMEWISNNYPFIIDSLTYSYNSNDTPMFIPLLFNSFKNIQADDLSMDEITMGETFQGLSLKMPTTSMRSEAGGNVTITYDEYLTPIITYLHKVWFEYISKVKFGDMTPSKTTIKNKELDYVSSLYFFFTKPDGETLTFWGRYMGLYPSGLPYSVFSTDVGSHNVSPVNCSYSYTYKEFLDPEILVDFNEVISGGVSDRVKNNIGAGDLSGITEDYSYTSWIDNNNPYNIPETSSLSGTGGQFTESTSFSKVGIYKKDKEFKIIFYN